MNYQIENGIALISIDDGKANTVGPDFIATMNAHLDKAEQEANAVILTGRAGMFCAGFDLKTFQKGPDEAEKLVGGGMRLLTRLYGFPLPLLAACEGHAYGLGAFLLMVSDNRIGSDTDFQICLPETSIGMPFTPVLLSLVHDRLSLSEKTAAMLQSKRYSPQEAVKAGFLDSVVESNELMPRAMELAQTLAALPKDYYCLNKRNLRQASLADMSNSLES